jgi:hypothetical protein
LILSLGITFWVGITFWDRTWNELLKCNFFKQ